MRLRLSLSTIATILIGANIVFNYCTSSHTLKTFKSDGCSLFPDFSSINDEDWCECCVEHDKAYWKGGTKQERRMADSLFKQCIIEKTKDETLAEIMYMGVRLGGSPYFPTWYRWGYGWNFQHGYEPLSEDENKMAEKMIKEYVQNKCSN